MTGNRRQKSATSVLGGLSGRFLTPPERASKMTSKKHRKNCENRGFWCPKTLPKPSPKPFQIDIPKNTWFLNAFSIPSFKFKVSKPWKYAFRLDGSTIFRDFEKNQFLHFSKFGFRKPSPKSWQNEVGTLEKLMPKTYCFLTSIFWGFGLDFGRSWASKMEPS